MTNERDEFLEKEFDFTNAIKNPYVKGKYSVLIQYDDKDKIYVASIPEIPGCMAHGNTREQALKEIDIAYKLWIETAKEVGRDSPHNLGIEDVKI